MKKIIKEKCTLVQALRLYIGRTTHRGNRGIALLFLDHDIRRAWGISVTPRPLPTSGKDPVPIVQEAGWAPGPVWTGAENLAPTGIRCPDCPVHSQSLYRLHYPAYWDMKGSWWSPIGIAQRFGRSRCICLISPKTEAEYFSETSVTDCQLTELHIP